MDWDLGPALVVLLRVGVAFALALPIGWERGKGPRHVGLRTFPLVAVGACGYLLLARHTFGDSPEAQARIIQGLMTGIGFIGGGAILKQPGEILGLATAASIWNTGAIGAAAAFGQFGLGLALCVVNLVILHVFGRRLAERDSRPPNRE